MTKSSAIAAAAKTAAGGRPLFVFASRRNDLPDDDKRINQIFASAKYSEFACKSCGTHMHARAGTAPFCVTCGSGEGSVTEAKATKKTGVSASSETIALQCSVCDHMTVMESAVATSIVATSGDGPIHCSCCGKPMFVVDASEGAHDKDAGPQPATELKVPPVAVSKEKYGDAGEPSMAAAETDTEGDDMDDTEDDDVALDDLDDVEASGPGEGGEEMEKPEDDEGDTEDEIKSNLDNFKGKQAPPFKKKASADAAAELEKSGAKSPKAGDGGVDVFSPDVPKLPDGSLKPVSADAADGDPDMVLEPFTLEEEEPVDVLDEPLPVATTEETVGEEIDLPPVDGDPLVDAMELDDTDMALAFVRANGRVLAVKGAVVVAAFTRRSAGDNYVLANSDALPIAAKAAVTADGLRKGLLSVGFELLKVPTKSDVILSRKVQEIKAAAAKKEQDKKREFASIFALAAAGLNRGNWKGFENPLRATLERELANMGVQAPKRIAASILEESGLKYAETLLQVSNKLSAMSAAARAELSGMLDMTSIVAAAGQNEEDEDEEDPATASAIETRFAVPALLRANVVKKPTPRGDSGASAVLAGSAPLQFASV